MIYHSYRCLHKERLSGFMNKLMIGIEFLEEFSENDIESFFSDKGLDKDDDYFYKGENKFEYFFMEKAKYVVLKEHNNIDFFTENSIEYIRTLSSDVKVFVQEDDGSGKTIDEDIIFNGTAVSFVKHWDSLGE